MRLKELSVELQDRIVSRNRSGEGNKSISATWKDPKNTVASIIPNTLLRAGCRAKLSNRGRRALVRENLPEGQPSLQHSTTQAFMLERQGGSHSSVKST
ncbi:unnamed protein product [Oncorhynchus mykiss]|uniref:Sleeping Beauty transposase HTH domain-containing protein n=1 Tax=Oncorhynchus mykiss TaxID=8022 RepID=A0A060YFJ0_ONCMY|nr:unnamed protein product [Oncorhynchus mykiss]